MKRYINKFVFIVVLIITVLITVSGTLSASEYTTTFKSEGRVFDAVVDGTGSNIKTTIYEEKSSGRVKLVSYKNRSARVNGKYGNYLYLTLAGGNDCEAHNIYRFNLKTKKTFLVKKGALLHNTDGRYALANTPTGFPLALSYYIVDLKTAKVKTISSKCYGAEIYGNKIYYYPVKDVGGNTYSGKVYVCSVSLKNKKSISGDIKSSVGYGTKIRPTYIAYGKYVNGKIKYYKYYYSSKKNIQISSTQYRTI